MEFTEHGWLRHRADRAPPDRTHHDGPDRFHARSALATIAERMAASPSEDAQRGARLVRLLAEGQVHHGLLLDCLRVGLLARLGQEISLNMATMGRKVLTHDAIEISCTSMAGYLIVQALVMLGDEPLYCGYTGADDATLAQADTLAVFEAQLLERARERLADERQRSDEAREQLESERERVDKARERLAHERAQLAKEHKRLIALRAGRGVDRGPDRRR